MGTSSQGPNNGGQNRHDGQRNYQHSNERNRDHARSDTSKNQYQDYDEKLTNDQHFEGGVPDTEMDFRDRQHNLEAPENEE